MRKVGVGACAVAAIVLAVGAAEIAKAAPPKGGGGGGAAHGAAWVRPLHRAPCPAQCG